MKILTGELRGRVIPFRPNPKLRPTADKTRKAMIDALAQVLPGRRVLDLFAGTGALGLEALSSGAESAVFVESDAATAGRLEEAVEALGLEDRADVLRLDARDAVKYLAKGAGYFDIVFLDPPYEKGLGLEALEAVSAAGLVGPGAVVVYECASGEKAPAQAGILRAVRRKEYEDTRVTFYQVPEKGED